MLTNINFEKDLWDKNVKLVVGVDEVGRGCIAGPIVGAAVIWDPSILKWNTDFPSRYESLCKITDSKKLSKNKRKMLNEFIVKNCLGFGIAELSNKIIDSIGVGEANKKVLVDAILELENKLNRKVDHILSDFIRLEKYNDVHRPETPIVKGDSVSLSIASASIIAKQYRDNLMENYYHNKYSIYGFNKNVGYGTKQHIEAIKGRGYCDIHRMSYKLNLS
jgi:ribonuclease HII